MRHSFPTPIRALLYYCYVIIVEMFDTENIGSDVVMNPIQGSYL